MVSGQSHVVTVFCNLFRKNPLSPIAVQGSGRTHVPEIRTSSMHKHVEPVVRDESVIFPVVYRCIPILMNRLHIFIWTVVTPNHGRKMNLAVFELNRCHTETFPIYENYLPFFLGLKKANYFYFYLPRKRTVIQNLYKNVSPVINGEIYFLIRQLGLRVPVLRRKVQRLVDATDADVAIFNSIEPERVQRVFHAVRARKKIALIHNPEKLSLTKDSCAHYFVLSKTVYEKYRQTLPLDGYLLPFFKPFSAESSPENTDRVVVGIQGRINFRRRDYDFLVAVARRLKERKVTTVQFNIIGTNNCKGGKRLRKMIRKFDLQQYFKLHKHLDDPMFYNEINRCDLLMPLLGPAQQSYLQDKTSATLSHAVAYNKPMILSEQNAEAWGVGGDTQFIYQELESCVHVLENVTGMVKKKRAFKAWRKRQIDKNRTFLVSGGH